MSSIHHGRTIDSAGEFTVLECETCGFKHLDPLPGVNVLKDFYTKQYYQSHKPDYIQQDEQDKEYWQIAFSERIDILKRLTPGRKILDVGCGAGMFLAYAAVRGWQCRGVEPSLSATEIARSKGLDIFHGSFEDFLKADSSAFDVICLKNILEHVPDPQMVLENCRTRLTENGILFIEVPNDYEWMQKAAVRVLRQRKSWLAVPDHINYFDFGSLARLLSRVGLMPVKRFTTFPIYGCLFLGLNFIADKQVGPRAHQMRLSFELFWERCRLGWLKRYLYVFLAWIGTGRTAIFYCRSVNNKGGFK